MQAGRHRGCGRQGAEPGELLAVGSRREVVAQKEHTDPGVLDPASMIKPRRAGQDGLADHAEPEPASHMPPLVDVRPDPAGCARAGNLPRTR